MKKIDACFGSIADIASVAIVAAVFQNGRVGVSGWYSPLSHISVNTSWPVARKVPTCAFAGKLRTCNGWNGSAEAS